MNPHSRSVHKPQRLREKLKETVREAILESAEAVFARQGLHKARVEEIAEHAGISVGTVYNYFDDRQALLNDLLASRRQELMAKVDRFLQASAPEPFHAKLEGFLRLLLEHFQSHLKLLALLFEDEGSGTVATPKPMLRELNQRTEKLLRSGIEAGALRPEHASLYPGILLGMMRGILVRRIWEKQEIEPDELLAPLVRFFLEGAGTAKARR
jgi:AcrR family transcriptional regulator